MERSGRGRGSRGGSYSSGIGLIDRIYKIFFPSTITKCSVEISHRGHEEDVYGLVIRAGPHLPAVHLGLVDGLDPRDGVRMGIDNGAYKLLRLDESKA